MLLSSLQCPMAVRSGAPFVEHPMCMMHGWAPHVATGQQALIRCTAVLACSLPSSSLVRLGWVPSTHTPSGGTWVMHTRGIGLVCMFVRSRTAPADCAKFCTYLCRFARPGKMPAEPYFELPISLLKLRRLMQFRLGSHDLPIEQGRL